MGIRIGRDTEKEKETGTETEGGERERERERGYRSDLNKCPGGMILTPVTPV